MAGNLDGDGMDGAVSRASDGRDAARPGSARSDGQAPLPDTRLGRLLQAHREEVKVVALRWGARNVRVFGSVARGEDSASSDIDLLVDFDRGITLRTWFGLEQELCGLLGVDVDVGPAADLKPGLRDEVLAEAIPL